LDRDGDKYREQMKRYRDKGVMASLSQAVPVTGLAARASKTGLRITGTGSTRAGTGGGS